jgi:hypothetical protein
MQFIPNLTRNQWLWLGGATALGVTEVVSAPIAVVLAALPVLDSLANEEASGSTSLANNGTGRNAGARRRARRRSTAAPRASRARRAAASA